MKLDHFGSFLRRLHEDEEGDVPIGTLLIVGLVVIPLVIVLVTFRNELTTWLKTQWDRVIGADTTTDPFGAAGNGDGG